MRGLNLIYVALGGALGAVTRYCLTRLSCRYLGTNFPYATLIVNSLGALLMGFLFGLFMLSVNKFSESLRLVLIVGFLGGFTTFSAFTLETYRLFANHNPGLALLNIVLNNGFCLLALGLGINLAKTVS